jgi:phosphatidylglycerol:prolipoprotein diacylglycerol transferase
VVLFILLNWYRRQSPPVGAISGLFLVGYGTARILAEFFREPDAQVGYLLGGWLTEGQLLSLPMVLLGAYLMWQAYQRQATTCNNT